MVISNGTKPKIKRNTNKPEYSYVGFSSIQLSDQSVVNPKNTDSLVLLQCVVVLLGTSSVTVPPTHKKQLKNTSSSKNLFIIFAFRFSWGFPHSI